MTNLIIIGVLAGIVLGLLNLYKRFLGTLLGTMVTLLFAIIAFMYQGDWASLGYALLSVAGIVAIVAAEVSYRLFIFLKKRR